jgi:hypothetical protein
MPIIALLEYVYASIINRPSNIVQLIKYQSFFVRIKYANTPENNISIAPIVFGPSRIPWNRLTFAPSIPWNIGGIPLHSCQFDGFPQYPKYRSKSSVNGHFRSQLKKSMLPQEIKNNFI